MLTPVLRLKAPVVLATLLSLLLVACCGPKPSQPQPLTQYGRFVEVEVQSWVDIRSDDRVMLKRVMLPEAAWRDARDLEQLGTWFALNATDPEIWDMRGLITRLKATELAQGHDDATLLQWIKRALAEYREMF